jgi:iron(III) transport system permease protein
VAGPDAPTVLSLGVGLVLLYLVVPPFIFLFQTSFWVATSATDGYVSTENYVKILTSPDLPVLLGNSLAFALGTSVVGLLVGGPLAWLVERTNTPFKNLAYVSAFTALSIPAVVKAIGWVYLLSPRNGVINVWLMELFGLQTAPFNLYSLAGMILVSGLIWAPGVFLLMVVPFRTMDAALAEAANANGASTWQTFWRVTFPLARPAVLAVLLITFVQSVEAFEIPAIVGIPGKVFVLTSEVYLRIKTGMYPDYGVASAYSLILMALAAAGIYYYSRATRDAKRFTTVSGKGFRPRLVNLRAGRPLGAACVLFLPTLIALPVAILLWASLQPFYSRPSLESLSRISLGNYVTAFANSEVQRSMTNSTIVSGFAATISVAITIVVAWLLLRTRIPGRHIFDYLISATLIFPGIVLGIAIVRTYLTIPLPVYGTIWILVIAYVTRSLPYAMRYTHPGLIQIHEELEESAQLSGAGWLTTVLKILVPLMMPAIFGAWIYVFFLSVRELSMASVLVSSTSPVVSTAIFDLWEHGQTGDMAAFSVVVTSLFVVFSIVLRKLSDRFGLQV